MWSWFVRLIKGVCMLAQMFFTSETGGGSIVPSLAGGTTESIGTSPQAASVNVLRNGTITSTGADTAFSTQYWHTSGNTTIGDAYWVRFTRVTGTSTNYAGAAVSTWHQISSTRSCGYDVPEAAGEFAGTYTIEIASDSGGSTIVSTSASGAYVVTANSTV